mmetsp:Transcript_60660/g.195437  ORF Transcript_60660/g.195437 Transcript_60660/m.195437 type:complete len:203 (-) Transcript_60660:23-631(-)
MRMARCNGLWPQHGSSSMSVAPRCRRNSRATGCWRFTASWRVWSMPQKQLRPLTNAHESNDTDPRPSAALRSSSSSCCWRSMDGAGGGVNRLPCRRGSGVDATGVPGSSSRNSGAGGSRGKAAGSPAAPPGQRPAAAGEAHAPAPPRHGGELHGHSFAPHQAAASWSWCSSTLLLHTSPPSSPWQVPPWLAGPAPVIAGTPE